MLPLWGRMADEVGAHRELRRRHRQDGRVTPEEEDAEERDCARLETIVSDYAESDAIGSAIRHNGFESKRAQQLMRERCKRRGHLRLVVVNGEPDEAA